MEHQSFDEGAEHLLRLLHRFESELSHIDSLPDAMTYFVEAAVRMPGVEAAALHQVDEAEGTLVLAAQEGMPPAYLEGEALHPPESDLCRIVWRGDPVYGRCDELAPSLGAVLHREGFRCGALIPIVNTPAIHACAVFASKSHDSFPDSLRFGMESLCLHAESVFYRAFVESGIRAGVWALAKIDFRYRLEWANPAFLRLFGLEGGGKGEAVEELFADAERFHAAMAHARSGGRWVGELTGRKKDGSEFPLLFSAFTVKNEAGVSMGLILACHDIGKYKRMRNDLKESEARYRRILDTVNVGVGWLDRRGVIRGGNRAALEILGYAKGELPGRFVGELAAPAWSADLYRRLQREMEGTIRFESQLRRKDGRIIDVEVNASRLEQGNEFFYLVAFQDISARKRAEERVRKSEAHLARAQLISHVGSWEWDMERGELHWSEETYRIFGVDPRSFEPTYPAFVEAIHPEDRVRVEEAVDRALHQGEPYDIEHRILRPDGTVRWVREVGEVLYEKEGRPSGMVGVAHDISERKEAEELIRSERDKFRGMLSAMGDEVAIVNRRYVVEYQNEMSRNRVGDAEGERCFRKICGLDRPPDVCRLQEALKSGRICHRESLERHGRRYESTWSPFRDMDGEMKAIVWRRDITEKKRLEEDALRATRLASLGELAAGVAHEINNPINSIINYAQLLLDLEEGEEKESGIPSRILKEGRRVAEIVRNLLSFAREHKEECGPARVRDILGDALGLLETRMERSGIRIEKDLPPDLPSVWVRSPEMLQVFLNLLNNAHYALNQRYSGVHPDKLLRIHAETISRQGRPFVRIVFYDQGTGVSPEVLDRVFDPFFSTKPRGEGTGLGLSISHGIVQAQGGDLRLESEEGEYTRVILDLPVEERGSTGGEP